MPGAPIDILLTKLYTLARSTDVRMNSGQPCHRCATAIPLPMHANLMALYIPFRLNCNGNLSSQQRHVAGDTPVLLALFLGRLTSLR